MTGLPRSQEEWRTISSPNLGDLSHLWVFSGSNLATVPDLVGDADLVFYTGTGMTVVSGTDELSGEKAIRFTGGTAHYSVATSGAFVMAAGEPFCVLSIESIGDATDVNVRSIFGTRNVTTSPTGSGWCCGWRPSNERPRFDIRIGSVGANRSHDVSYANMGPGLFMRGRRTNNSTMYMYTEQLDTATGLGSMTGSIDESFPLSLFQESSTNASGITVYWIGILRGTPAASASYSDFQMIADKIGLPRL